MEYLIQFGQLLLSISILVVLHEGGHFFAARFFKTKVESFYLFFNPWFSIYKKKIGDTEYGIGWLPLGGYVKIAGMIDESMDKEQMAKEPQPWEFRSKPAWQRLIIMLGGIIVNVIVGFLIYSFVLMGYGEKYLPTENLTDGVWVSNEVISEQIGIQTGDKIISINGEKYKSFSNTVENLLYAEKVIVDRDGEKIELTIPEDVLGKLIENKRGGLLGPRIPYTVGGIAEKGSYVAKTSDLKVEDQVVGINDIRFKYYDEYKEAIVQFSDQDVILKVKREGQIVDVLKWVFMRQKQLTILFSQLFLEV